MFRNFHEDINIVYNQKKKEGEQFTLHPGRIPTGNTVGIQSYFALSGRRLVYNHFFMWIMWTVQFAVHPTRLYLTAWKLALCPEGIRSTGMTV